MASSLSDELCLYLQTQGLSLNFNGAGTINLFSSILPDAPDLAVAIIERGGLIPLLTMTGSSQAESRFEHPTVQVRIRAGMQGYVTGNALVQGVFKALQGINETTLNVGGSLFHLIVALQSPIYLGRDDRQRHEWSHNYRILWSNAQR